MHKPIQYVAIITFVLFSAWGVSAQANIKVGDTPELSLVTMRGDNLSSESLSGKIVILEFWATWCPPCVKMVPHLKELHENYEEKGVQLISVSIDDKAGTAQRFINNHKMAWTQVHDGSQTKSYSKMFGVRGIPHAFIISPDGEVLWNGHPARIDQPLDDALESHPPRIEEAQSGPSIELDTAEPMSDEQAIAIVDELIMMMQQESIDMAALLNSVASMPADQVLNPKLRTNILPLVDQLDQWNDTQKFALIQAYADQAEGVGKLAAMLKQFKHELPGTGTINPKLAEARLNIASRAADRGDHLKAYETYQWMILKANDPLAQEKIAEYVSNEELMNEIQAQIDDREARRLLSQAKMHQMTHKTAEAKAALEKLIKYYPESAQAEEAQKMLDTL